MLLTLRILGWGASGDLESDAQRPRRRSSVAATAAAVSAAAAAAAAGADYFKLVVFRTGNADFDLVAWAWVRDLDLAGDAVE